MFTVNEELATVKTVTVINNGKGKHGLYIPTHFEENGCDLENVGEITICQDKENKVIYFRYGDLKPAEVPADVRAPTAVE
ncbi:MAG: hypothetical protein A4E28_00014 [Methanocella sp. PtaU1.Bin125]|nr:MAG: hypothetical protein A4E28_00014 [Methanocella sp. PtaU1.Bin125]